MRQAVTASENDKLKRMMQEQQKQEQPEEHIAILQKQAACACGYCTLEEVEGVEKTFYHLL